MKHLKRIEENIIARVRQQDGEPFILNNRELWDKIKDLYRIDYTQTEEEKNSPDTKKRLAELKELLDEWYEEEFPRKKFESSGAVILDEAEQELYNSTLSVPDSTLLSWAGYSSKKDFEDAADVDYSRKALIQSNYEDILDLAKQNGLIRFVKKTK